jgi:TolB-like protein
VIRLTASLVDARIGMYVWTEAYDMSVDNPVLMLQTGLTSDLGSRLATSSCVMARLFAQAASKRSTLPADW